MDSVYLVLTVVFFAVTVALVYACDKLRGQCIYFKIHGKYKCHQNALTAAQKV